MKRIEELAMSHRRKRALEYLGAQDDWKQDDSIYRYMEADYIAGFKAAREMAGMPELGEEEVAVLCRRHGPGFE